jgi:hypothetical protein
MTGHTSELMGTQSRLPRSRPLLFWGMAVVTIVAGYADLARGGVTLAPILLVIGYCVLVPLAILK